MGAVGAIVRFLLTLVAFGCIALSCYLAFSFGWTRGSDLHTQWAFALLAGALDLTKSGILIVTMDKAWPERSAAWLTFVFLTFMSLWCAAGMTAVELANRNSQKAVATTQQTTRQAALDRLTAQRKQIPPFIETTAGAVDVAKSAVAAAERDRVAECDRRGERCRAREADERAARAALSTVEIGRAVTIKAADLDRKIETAQKDLDRVDLTAATRQADPQSENMAKTFGVSEDAISLLGHIIFALSVEIGSGLLPWLLFGHGRRELPHEIVAPSSAGTALVPLQAIPLIETPESVRDRFFSEVALPFPGERVAATKLYTAYSRWCMERSIEPMSVHGFGRDAPWEKQKLGGTMWYLNCRLAEAYGGPQLRLAVSN